MTKGGQKGNTNALKEGRKRVKFDVSLSGKRLAYFEQLAKQGEEHTPSNQEIIDKARQMYYEWVDSLQE